MSAPSALLPFAASFAPEDWECLGKSSVYELLRLSRGSAACFGDLGGFGSWGTDDESNLILTKLALATSMCLPVNAFGGGLAVKLKKNERIRGVLREQSKASPGGRWYRPIETHIVNALIARGFGVTLFHRGTHESEDIPDWVEHIHVALHPRATILRCPIVYGPHQLLPLEWCLARRALDRRPFVVLADGGLRLIARGYSVNMAHAVLRAN